MSAQIVNSIIARALVDTAFHAARRGCARESRESAGCLGRLSAGGLIEFDLAIRKKDDSWRAREKVRDATQSS